ncbi:MAG: hypothetical protein DYG83_08250 [Candidatus Brocadia sp. AMX2]|uniref:Uncharacterized protein n=1 Tax=Candidatus Brocadia sinica JPN1 TaxID=1197129 RepID=A0ABQ0K041_9BACT|nr:MULTISPECIES: hypothetical protein [Brocadia]KXK25373.1 MAG: hypothetical protein UZ01_03413 [Candidatus Brocadia sinica]MBC6932415.1 hypothetical protein [Candidatus Brocadia sp.]MBL1170712.1 hypothetical protein [Candidatus Brocadia sp. AMX1]NOG42128.1 hypothetical protein [Planctomycetota bacterium]KAA0244827.1 MAG: hypothetical protein EDM70_04915 [Candidatus Brocadia sp. AMX2]
MGIINRTRTYLGSLVTIAGGVGAVLVGAYIFSRIKERQEKETRLERIEQILQKLAEEQKKKE